MSSTHTPITTTTNRETGTVIELGLTEDFDLDPSQGKWSTVCATHGEVLMYDTLAVARSYAPHPSEWCSECATVVAK
jgi:hypothetical protein